MTGWSSRRCCRWRGRRRSSFRSPRAAPGERFAHQQRVDFFLRQGVPVEVVPGVTSALGAAAAAQIALTHRDAASVVSFVAGQCKGLAEQNWAGLAGKGRTLVIYLGVATCPEISEKLMADGVSPDMPVAVLERGTLEGH